MTVLECRNIRYGYPERGLFGTARAGRLVLDDVSVRLGAGECVGIVGESGSGKSTLLRTIVGLNPGYEGEIRLGGTVIDHSASRAALRTVRARVQMIFQDPLDSFNPYLTIRQMLGDALRLYRPELQGGSAVERMRELLRQVGLDGSALDRYPSEFSGGQLQRLAIARALTGNPSVLLCDEPTSALDVSIQAQILQLFRVLRQDGIGMIFVTHNLGVIAHIADHLVVMRHGRILEEGPVRRILGQPETPYTANLIAASPRLRDRGALMKVREVATAFPSTEGTRPA